MAKEKILFSDGNKFHEKYFLDTSNKVEKGNFVDEQMKCVIKISGV